MIERDKETVSRHSVLDPEQRTLAGEQRLRQGRRRSGLRRLIPVLMLIAIATLVARREIPAFGDWWEQTFAAQTWAVKQACREAALQQSGRREFARIIAGGRVHETGDGFYVDKLVLGEMGPDGAEQRINYSCYLDRSYQLVKINRLE